MLIFNPPETPMKQDPRASEGELNKPKAQGKKSDVQSL